MNRGNAAGIGTEETTGDMLPLVKPPKIKPLPPISNLLLL